MLLNKKQLLSIAGIISLVTSVQAQLNFAPAVNYAVGTNPLSVFSADFNGDGKADLATANRNSNNVSVLLGSGTGTFAAAVNYATGLSPLSVFSADFNGDGKADLVTANRTSSNVSVLLGSGTGTFAAAVNYVVGTNPFSVFSADLNGDGKADLATANYGSNNVSVLLGSGTGTFSAAVNYTLGTTPNSVFSADFNGDGKADLVTSNGTSNNVSVLLGSGTGTFAAAVNYAVGAGPQSVFSADFNGDGKADLATANYSGSNVSVLLGSGTGTFSAAVNYAAGTNPYSVFSADFNGDAKVDVATANYNGNNVSVLLNTTILPAAASLNFDGVNDYVAINSTPLLSMTTAITIEAWVKTTGSPTGEQYIVSKNDDSFYMALNVAGNVGKASVFINGVSTGWLFSNANTINDNNWHHVAATYDGTKIKIYIDGILDNSVSATGTIQTGGSNVNFGCRSGTFYLKGSIDEARIWNVARTQCEINTHKNCEIPGTASGLVANYHFNQGFDAGTNTSVTTLTDASGNVNTGTLTNFALTTGTISNWVAPGGVTSGSVTPANLAITVGSTVTNSVICSGNSTTLNGTGANSYVWTNGVTNAVAFTPTVTNTYTVTGTNTLTGCTNTAVSTVTVNSLPVISVNSGSICSGTSFTMAPSGGNTYSYSNGSSVATPTANTTYTVTGTNTVTGCTNTALSTVTVNSLPVVSVNSGSICAGSSFTMVPSGGNAYSYSNGSSVATPTANATYTVTGTNTVTGCSNTAVSSVTVNSLPVVSVNSSTICAGQTATLTATGGGTYQWSNGATTSSIVVPINGMFTVSVTSAAGCEAPYKTATVTVNSLPTISVNSGAICAGQSFTMIPSGGNTYSYSNGSSVATPTANATYTVTGTNTVTGCSNTAVSTVTVNSLPTISVSSGAICAGQSYTITANGASTYTSVPSLTGPVVSPTTTTNYSITGTDANGCVSSNTAVSTVTVNSLPVVSVNSSTICAGQTTTLTATGGGTYMWSTGANTSSIVVAPIFNSMYTVSVTSTAGCEASYKTATVTVNSLPTISVNSGSICAGQSFTMVPSGASTYTYSNGSDVATPTLNANYTVTGTDANGCENTAVSSVTVNPLPVITSNPGNVHLCGDVAASFGISSPGTNTYQWYFEYTQLPNDSALIDGSYTEIDFNTDTMTIQQVLTGNYNNYYVYCEVTNQYNCVSYSANDTIWANPTPTVTVNSGVICVGQSFTMIPSGANTYAYSNGSDVATPTANANYTVTGTDANGCENTAVSTVTVNALPTVTVNSGAICAGQSFTMVPSGATSYTYSNGTDVVTPTANANYTVTGTDANGCENTAVSTVTVNALPTVSVNSGAICAGQSFTMVPTGASTYTYSNGTDVVTPSANDSYTVTGTDANGCENTAVSTVTVNTLPTVSVNSGAICAGQSFTMVPTGATTYTYSNGTDVVTPASYATYSVSGTDANGCISNVAAVSSVTVNALPTILAATNNTLLCTGESATLTVTGASTYTWSTTENTTNIAVSPTVQTTYTVNGTDANGCENITTITQDVSLCTGIATLINNASYINVYPNPNNGLFVIELPSKANVIVTNALGQIVITEIVEAGKHNLDIHNETIGVYFVKVIENNKQYTIKVIKQ